MRRYFRYRPCMVLFFELCVSPADKGCAERKVFHTLRGRNVGAFLICQQNF